MTDLTDEIKSGLLAEIVEYVGDPVTTFDGIRAGLEALWNDANETGDQQKAELVNTVWERAQQLSTANNMLIDVTAAAREALKLTNQEYQKILLALRDDYTKSEVVTVFAQQLEADVIEVTYSNNFVSEDPGFDICELGELNIDENDAQVFFDLLFSRNGHSLNNEEKTELEEFITDFVNRYTERCEKVEHEQAD